MQRSVPNRSPKQIRFPANNSLSKSHQFQLQPCQKPKSILYTLFTKSKHTNSFSQWVNNFSTRWINKSLWTKIFRVTPKRFVFADISYIPCNTRALFTVDTNYNWTRNYVTLWGSKPHLWNDKISVLETSTGYSWRWHRDKDGVSYNFQKRGFQVTNPTLKLKLLRLHINLHNLDYTMCRTIYELNEFLTEQYRHMKCIPFLKTFQRF